MKFVAVFCAFIILSSMVWQGAMLGERDAEVEYLTSENLEYKKMVDRVIKLDERSIARDMIVEWRGRTGR